MTDQKIYYKKVRDLGTIFSAAFGFIKQNFKTLYGGLLFFSGPFLLVAAVVSANMFGTSLGLNKIFKSGLSSFYGEFLISYFVILTVTLIGMTVYNVILNKNLIENEKLLPSERLTINHTINNFFNDFWRVLGNTLLLIFICFIFLLVIALIFFAIITLTGGTGGGNNTGLVILIVFFFLVVMVLLIIYGPIFAYIPMAAIFVCQRDGIPIFAALRKVFHYLKGNFWNTWVIIVVGSLAYMVMAAIVQIPLFIITIITAFSRLSINTGNGIQDEPASLLLVIIVSICSLLSHGVSVFFNLIVIYQFTSLEEKKEGVSIIDKINQIR